MADLSEGVVQRGAEVLFENVIASMPDRYEDDIRSFWDPRPAFVASVLAASEEIDCPNNESGFYDRVYPHGIEYGEDGECPLCGGSGKVRVIR